MFARIHQMKGILYALLFIFIIVSCRKHKDFIPTPNAPINNNITSARITGLVKDQTGAPVSGVTITAQGKTTVTGEFGEFTIASSSADNRIYVKAQKSGFFTGTATEIASSDGVTNVQIILATQVIAATLDGSTGGTAQDVQGNEVSIPSNGVVTASGDAYNGDVNVSLLHLDPTSPDFGLLTQGADMTATNASGAEGALISYGVLKVELSDNSGNELQLASGKTSTVRMTIAPEQLTNAPSTIPLWYFDETLGRWIEEGVATKVGNEYVGTVTHFTDWNCDVFTTSQATITGKVVDCSGKPVPYIFLQSGQSYAYTDQNGVYTRRVPSDIAFDVTVNTGYGQTYTSSSSVAVPALSGGQELTLPDLVLDQCLITVTGNLWGCNNNKIYGYVEVNGNFSYAENGTFSVPIAADDSITVIGYDAYWGFTVKSIEFPSGETTINVGDLVVCQDYMQTGQTSYTINGAGFVNQDITLNTVTAMDEYSYRIGQFNIYEDTSMNGSSKTLYIDAAGRAIQQPSHLPYLSFTIDEHSTPIGVGSYPLTYAFDSNAVATFYMSIFNESLSESEDYTSQSGTITITRIDDEGGLIEGTFSATLHTIGTYEYDSVTYTWEYIPGPDPITITNGQFSVLRYPDYDMGNRVEISDVERAIIERRKRQRRK